MTLREFVHKIGFQVDDAGLEKADKLLEASFKKVQGMNENIQKFADRMGNIGKKLTYGLSIPIGALATTSVMASVKLEDMRKEWEVMLGSKPQAKAFIDEVMRLEEHQPFKTEEILSYTKELKRLGYSQKEMLPTFKRFSDIAAARGLPVGELIWKMGEVRRQGYVEGRFLKQFIRQGFIDREIIERITGKHGRALYSYAEKGKISADTIDKVFFQMGKKYSGAAAERARTTGKAFENFTHAIFRLRAAIGDMIVKGLHINGILAKLSTVIEWMADRINEMPGWMKGVALAIGGILFVLGPTLVGLKTAITLFLALKRASLFLGAGGLFTKGILGINAGLLTMLAKFGLIGAAIAGVILLLNDLWHFFHYGPVHSLIGSGGSKLWRDFRGTAPPKPVLSGDPLGGMGGFLKTTRTAPAGSVGASVKIDNINIGVPAGTTQEQKEFITKHVKESASSAYTDIVRRMNDQIMNNLASPAVAQ